MANDINKDNFSSSLENDKLVLVDFWLNGGPCNKFLQDQELANKYSENLTVCKVNVDENRELAIEYNIRSILLWFLKSGEMVDSLIGAVSLEELRSCN